MNAEQFVYWLNGYLELSGAQELSAAQVKSVREHLAFVLHKVTPPGPAGTGPPAPAWQPGPGWKLGHRGEWAFGGVQCGVCSSWTSNEGGVCYKCMSVTVTSNGNGVDLAESNDTLAGVAQCAEDTNLNTNPAIAAVHSTERWPIVDVLCVLTC